MNIRTQRYAVAVTLLVTLVLVSPLLCAQSAATGEIAGKVTDPPGAAIPNATLTLIGGKQPQSQSTDAAGRYRFSALPPGTYILDIRAQGFAKAERTVVVAAGQVSTTDVSLRVGQGGGVEVTAAATDSNVDERAPTFKVDVKLVNLFVTVLDQHGAPVATLKKDDFELLEDGQPQQIAVFDHESELPLSIVMAIDTSLSTRKDLKLELESARRFAHSIVRPVDRLSLYEFSETVHEVVPFTANLKQIDLGISGIRSGAATAMYDALYLASDALADRRGRKVIVIITDGGDTVSHTDYQEALREAQQAEAIVYSIIIVPIASSAGRDTGGEHALIQISQDTGGKYYYAESMRQLEQAFNQIDRELRTQYLLGYYPVKRIADSEFRRIEVRLRGEAAAGLRARHRSGYYTSKSK